MSRPRPTAEPAYAEAMRLREERERREVALAIGLPIKDAVARIRAVLSGHGPRPIRGDLAVLAMAIVELDDRLRRIEEQNVSVGTRTFEYL